MREEENADWIVTACGSPLKPRGQPRRDQPSLDNPLNDRLPHRGIMAETIFDKPPGPPPRALTPAVRRRSLLEPRVRFWWIAGLILAAAMSEFLVSELMTWNQERDIVLHGTTITATITAMGDGSLRGTVSPDNPVHLEFNYNGTEYGVNGWLEGRKESISIDQKVTIRINSNDPTEWTYRTEIPPIGHALMEPGMMGTFAAAALLTSYILRSRVLSIWKTGIAEQYEVETVGGPTALAPASRAVRLRSLRGRDQRLISLSIPQRLAKLKPGDLLWLIHPPGRPTVALPALVYDGQP